jgi:Pro-kumamolisin, activation domain/Bacterial Ig-like domain (group 3)
MHGIPVPSFPRFSAILILTTVCAVSMRAQVPATPLVTEPIDETKIVTLHGNVHPLAQPRYDIGAVPGSIAANRILLLLNRPAEREAALQQFMKDAHARGSASYHQWLTPQQFGTRFGPADSDIQQVSGWLSGMGFQVAGTSKGKTLIEFSGTVGQVNKAFHTQIRKYAINGELHCANASDPQIPQALAGIVRGVSALNDFRPRSSLHVVGAAHLDAATRKISPDFTLTGQNGPFYAVAPEDFATQYDLAPLYAAGINGSGKTIGIINDSNIDVNLDNAYQSLFGLAANAAQVVLDGGDPGINGDATEAYLDVEMAGAVAPGATVNLYIAAWDTVADGLNFPLILAATRAIEDNQADVLSVSFNECEGFIGTADNQILAQLWEQAAAQGQTVFVSAGDNGSAGCDNADTQDQAIYGLQVNGFASTPWNVAVGGTDFYYSDYASGAPSAANLWNGTNDANLGSLKARLPEQVWNDSFGFDAVNPNDTEEGHYLYTIDAGSGGASSCINSAASTSASALPFVCSPVSGTIYGYAKPSWQSGPGVPADGVRDLPDVSLFAANGYNLSAYPICANPGDCVPGANQLIPITLVGGTSASAPAMAAIMALVDQKYGRQGQADYTFYALAQQKPSAFHDITLGGNNVPCLEDNDVFSPNCGPDTGGIIDPGFNTLSGYPATTGYDLASGLGSVDANVMVTNWDSLTFAPTSTSLQLSPTSFAHGTPVTVNVSVESSSEGEKPQGGVSILTNSPVPASQSVDLLTLGSNGSATGSIDLPGGTYQVWADYGGDGLHSSSNSSPVSVTVTPEASNIYISATQTTYSAPYNPAVGCTPVVGPYEEAVASGSSVSPYTPLWLTAKPRGSTSDLTTATGSVTFTLDGQAASVPLNVSGIATWITPMSVNAGTHTVVASYAGDASYGASTSSPFTYTVQPIPITFAINPFAASSVTGTAISLCYPGNQCGAYTGDNLSVMVSLDGSSCQLPTGTVTVTLGSQTKAVNLTPVGFPLGEGSMGLATFPNLQAGTYQLAGAYSGDSFYPAASSGTYTVTVASPTDPLLPTTTVVTESPSVISYYGGTTLSVTVTTASGSKGPPTGYVNIYGDGGWWLWQLPIASSSLNTSTGSFLLQQDPNHNSFGPYIGLDQITAVYLGDSNYQLSVSAPIELNVVFPSVSPDFIMAPQVNQVTVQSGSSATVAINLAPQNEFSGTVALTCAPSSSQITCGLNPSSVMVNGQATATLTITAAAQTSGLAPQMPQRRTSWPVAAGILVFGFFVVGGQAQRKLRGRLLFSLCICIFAAALTISCGGGGSSTTPITILPSTPPPTLVTNSVMVTGTANGVVHNAKVTVVVQQAGTQQETR